MKWGWQFLYLDWENFVLDAIAQYCFVDGIYGLNSWLLCKIIIKNIVKIHVNGILFFLENKKSNEKIFTCNQQSVQENISQKIMLIKLFTAILVCRIDCVCTLAPVYTVLWKFFSNRGYRGWYNEVSHIISLTNYINGKLSLCQGQWAFTSLQCSYFGLFYLIEFKAFSDFFVIVTMQLYCCQALLFTY